MAGTANITATAVVTVPNSVEYVVEQDPAGLQPFGIPSSSAQTLTATASKEWRTAVTPTPPDDSDGDGYLNDEECPPASPCPDTDRDGIPNYLDPDDDGDSILTKDEPTGDIDGDGKLNYLDPDDDGDGRPTIVEHGRDDNRNGVPDEYEAGSILLLPWILP